MNPQQIYLDKMEEIIKRAQACEIYLSDFKRTNSVYSLESAVLQLRKTLESISLAAISPNKEAYKKLRLGAEKPADFRKDYNGRKILSLLHKINKDFYPIPLLPPVNHEGKWHFERKTEGYLTRKRFESTYDRLGKYLHSDNPWGDNKCINNMVTNMPQVLSELRALIEWHFTVIRSPDFSGIWVVEVPLNEKRPRIIIGQTSGEFIVK